MSRSFVAVDEMTRGLYIISMHIRHTLKGKALTIVPVVLGFLLFTGGTRYPDKNPDFIMGHEIRYQEFRREYKKGSGLITGKKYTMYACVDGTVRLPFYKGILSQTYYYGSACYSPEDLYISDLDFYSIQKRLEFKNMKGMYWVTVYVDIDGGIVVVDFKKGNGLL